MWQCTPFYTSVCGNNMVDGKTNWRSMRCQGTLEKLKSMLSRCVKVGENLDWQAKVTTNHRVVMKPEQS
jgi:hypothetical protein